MSERAFMTREQLDRLGDQIADLSLRIDVAKHTLLTHLREFDAHDGWAGSGFLSLVAWLAWRIDLGPTAAREYVRVARALGELPLVDAAFAAGKLSYSKVRAITRAATRANEQDFIDVAAGATASQIEQVSAAWRRTRVEATNPGEGPLGVDLRRFVRRRETSSGMVRIELQLPPEQANVVWEAMRAALDSGREAARARAREVELDASASAEAELDASPGAGASAEARAELDPAVLAAERADAWVSVAQAYLEHSPRTLGSGYELVVLTTQEQLEQGAGGVGGFLRDGTPIPLAMARMLACDCSRVDVTIGESGEILDVGRARRTIPSAIARALWLRDGGCRVPGCGRAQHLHAHHVQAWAEGGKTSQSNLVLLCPSHHALVHEGQMFVEVRAGKIEFRNAHGIAIRPVPGRGGGDGDGVGEELAELGELGEVAELLDEHEHERGAWRGWDGARLDLHDVLGWMAVAEQTRGVQRAA